MSRLNALTGDVTITNKYCFHGTPLGLASQTCMLMSRAMFMNSHALTKGPEQRWTDLCPC